MALKLARFTHAFDERLRTSGMRSSHGLLAHWAAGAARGRPGGLVLRRGGDARLHAIGDLPPDRRSGGDRRPPPVRARPRRGRRSLPPAHACSRARSASSTSSTPPAAKPPARSCPPAPCGSARSPPPWRASSPARWRHCPRELRVTVREGTTPALTRALRAGTLDLAILARTPPFRPLDNESPPLELTTLSERELVLGVPRRPPVHRRRRGGGSDRPDLGRQPLGLGRFAARRLAGPRRTRRRPLRGPRLAREAADRRGGAGDHDAGAGGPGRAAAGVRVVAVRGEPSEVRRLVLARRPGISSACRDGRVGRVCSRPHERPGRELPPGPAAPSTRPSCLSFACGSVRAALPNLITVLPFTVVMCFVSHALPPSFAEETLAVADEAVDHDVRAWAAVEDVGAGAADQDVVAVAAEEGVRAGAADEDVVAVAAGSA